MAMIVLDWKAYFENFQREHGDEGILLENRIVFEDGWSYELGSDNLPVDGGECPPPEAVPEQLELKRLYWQTKSKIYAEEAKQLCKQLRVLLDVQESHSLSLQQVLEAKEGASVQKLEVSDLALDNLLDHIRDLANKSNHASEQAKLVQYVPLPKRKEFTDLKLSLAEVEKKLCS